METVLPEQVFVGAVAIGEVHTRKGTCEPIAADPGGKMPGPYGLAETSRLIAWPALPYALATTRAGHATIRNRLSQQNRFHLTMNRSKSAQRKSAAPKGGGAFDMGVDQPAITARGTAFGMLADRPTPRPRRCGGPEHHGVSLFPEEHLLVDSKLAQIPRKSNIILTSGAFLHRYG